ncbi:MAG: hypothetical protein ACI3XE_00105, partial [Eubacteriales bacterium]
LTEVCREEAILHNQQLSHPSEKPQKRTTFFAGLEKGKHPDALVHKCYPKSCIKQRIKGILFHLKIHSQGGFFRISVQEKPSK